MVLKTRGGSIKRMPLVQAGAATVWYFVCTVSFSVTVQAKSLKWVNVWG